MAVFRITVVVTLALFGCALRAVAVPASPQLLRQAVDDWLGERDHWAFTQRAVEYENGTPHERLERFDPSRAGNARWQLLAIDGKTPTPEQRQKWADKKFKRHPRRIDASIGDFFDFGAARILAETPNLVRYEVPLRKDKNWLFPTDKVGVSVTINKETHALEHLSARVREPFRVLLGVAKVTTGDADLDFMHFNPASHSPATAQPAGSARVSVFKLGERVDFTWSDFRRVTPNRTAAKGDGVAVEVLAEEVLTADP